MKESSLKAKTAKGLFWGGVGNGLQQLFNLFFGIFLARLLDASDYGMIGGHFKRHSRRWIRRSPHQ